MTLDEHREIGSSEFVNRRDVPSHCIARASPEKWHEREIVDTRELLFTRTIPVTELANRRVCRPGHASASEDVRCEVARFFVHVPPRLGGVLPTRVRKVVRDLLAMDVQMKP